MNPSAIMIPRDDAGGTVAAACSVPPSGCSFDCQPMDALQGCSGHETVADCLGASAALAQRHLPFPLPVGYKPATPLCGGNNQPYSATFITRISRSTNTKTLYHADLSTNLSHFYSDGCLHFLFHILNNFLSYLSYIHWPVGWHGL